MTPSEQTIEKQFADVCNALYNVIRILDQLGLTAGQRDLLEGATGAKGQLNAVNPDSYRF